MSALHLRVDIGAQRLECVVDGVLSRSYAVSTALNGTGQREGSECTPVGAHVVRARIGAGLPPGAVLVARRPTGEIYTPAMRKLEPDRDWILTRILWLGGLEPGRNLDGDVDTMRRYIYIHGAPDEATMGEPGSHGCIRMRNDDIVELFDRVRVGTRVLIERGGQ